MKARTLILVLILICILVVVVPVLFAGGSKKEELYGTWINEDYKGSTPPFGKNVFNPDGTFKFFRKEPAPWEKDVEVLEGGWISGDFGTYTIEDEWTDSNGNVWYKVEAVIGGLAKFNLLMKISDSNRVLEYMVDGVDYREEIDPTDVPYHYRILYRQ